MKQSLLSFLKYVYYILEMTISLNNQTVEIEAQQALSTLISQHIGEKQNGIAVAVNGQVVPKTSWTEVIVNENDEILIIKATQGG